MKILTNENTREKVLKEIKLLRKHQRNINYLKKRMIIKIRSKFLSFLKIL